jgi:hypothetical protein
MGKSNGLYSTRSALLFILRLSALGCVEGGSTQLQAS